MRPRVRATGALRLAELAGVTAEPACVQVLAGAGDLAGLSELAVLLRERVQRLAAHREGVGPLTPDQLARHALGALAAGHALSQRAQQGRWLCATDALAAGAPIGHVAAAMGLEPEELRTGLVEWADGQLRRDLITPNRHEQVLELVVRVDHDSVDVAYDNSFVEDELDLSEVVRR